MNFIQIFMIFSLAVSSAVAAPKNTNANLSVHIQEMIQHRKMYALKNIAGMEKQISEHNASRRRLDSSKYENAVENLSKHKKSLDRIALVEDQEMQRFSRGLRS